MIGINGINAVVEAADPAAPRKRATTEVAKSGAATDQIAISPEAAAAGNATKLIEQSREVAESEIRQQRIEEAKRKIEEGAHEVQEVVAAIAQRIAGAIPQGY